MGSLMVFESFEVEQAADGGKKGKGRADRALEVQLLAGTTSDQTLGIPEINLSSVPAVARDGVLRHDSNFLEGMGVPGDSCPGQEMLLKASRVVGENYVEIVIGGLGEFVVERSQMQTKCLIGESVGQDCFGNGGGVCSHLEGKTVEGVLRPILKDCAVDGGFPTQHNSSADGMKGQGTRLITKSPFVSDDLVGSVDGKVISFKDIHMSPGKVDGLSAKLESKEEDEFSDDSLGLSAELGEIEKPPPDMHVGMWSSNRVWKDHEACTQTSQPHGILGALRSMKKRRCNFN
ncbi:hypothetical protein SUGI_0999340 [Cryptomeria japonica]|nr:hypothetical protein SUGI_0999340 [Cryptomeria japonica]